MTDAEYLAQLKAAYYTGAKRIKTADGRETEFRDLDEMRDAIERLESSISGQGRWRWMRMVPGRRGG